MDLKTCTKCKFEKSLDYFEFRSDTKKHRNYCRKCSKGYETSLKEKQELILKLYAGNLKECSKCKETKKLDCFNNDKQTVTGKTSYCTKCINNKYTKDEIKNFALKNRYSITLDIYNKMYINQKGCCDICKNKFKKLVVDHCHKSTNVRGLLCNSCNSGIGFLKDNIESLKNAIIYLNKQEVN
jgi:hypothetical protein